MTQGVYLIINVRNGKTYVGSSNNIERRWAEHRSLLRSGRHGNRYLLAAYMKYGPEAFVISTLEVVADRLQLIEREIAHMRIIRPAYNLALPRGTAIGHKHTPETKAKIAASRTGKPLTVAHRALLAKKQQGWRPSAAMKAAQRNAVAGKTRSVEVRAKIAAAHTQGGTHCLRGHKFTAKNTHVRPNGTRQCRTCANLKARERRKRKVDP